MQQRKSFGSRYGRKPKSVVKSPTYAPNDPDRYLVQSIGTGEFVVRDRSSNAIVASQLDSRQEAEDWVKERVSA